MYLVIIINIVNIIIITILFFSQSVPASPLLNQWAAKKIRY